MSDARTLLRTWRWLSPLPGGRWVFGRLVHRRARYLRALGVQFVEVRAGRVELLLPRRRALEHRDGTLDLLALTDAGALAAATVASVTAPPTHESSVRGLQSELVKNARSEARVVAELELLPALGDLATVPVGVIAFDAEGEAVLRLTVQLRFSRRTGQSR